MSDDQDLTAPLVTPKRWQCCHCGGTGVDSHGETCRHCDGHGYC